MPNGHPKTVRGPVVQKPLIGVSPRLAGVTPPSPMNPRMLNARPTQPRVPEPNAAQRQPIQHGRVHQHPNCGINGCAPHRALPTATPPGRGANQQIKQHSPPQPRIAQPKFAQPRFVPPKALQPRSASSRSAVVQRAFNSAFTPTMAVNLDQYVVTQVDSGLGGMFGHSELFIEHWIAPRAGTANRAARPARVGAYKIHVQTLGGPKIDIVPLAGAIDTTAPRVRSHRSYTANRQQFEKIMQTAIAIRTKMDDKKIAYAEILPDRDQRWKTTTGQGEAEMSCKSFTDILLMEAGLRTGFGGTFINHPGDL